MLFDIHAHYDDERFDQDRYVIIEKAHYDEGVTYIINAASDFDSIEKSIEFSKKYSFVFAAIGIHPHNAKETIFNELAKIYNYADSDKIVAIGEIGLDYYYEFSPKEMQIKTFVQQIGIAKELKLPIVIHNRDSHEDMLKIIKQENAKEIGGVFHCFSGSVEMAKELLKNNFYISVGGPVTFKNARKVVEVVKYVPEDRLLVETDCPYLTPEPFRGKRNYSGYLKYIVAKVAEIKGLTFDEASMITTKNAIQLFGINSTEVH